MSALAAVGPPNPQEHPERCSILHGLEAAVESLCSITEYQHEARKTLMETADRVANRGRIICLTNAKRSARRHHDACCIFSSLTAFGINNLLIIYIYLSIYALYCIKSFSGFTCLVLLFPVAASLLVIRMCGCWRTLCGRPYRTRTSGPLDRIGQFEACANLVGSDPVDVFLIKQGDEFCPRFEEPLPCWDMADDKCIELLWECCVWSPFRLMPIQQCELVLVHVYPQGDDTLVSDRPKKEVGQFILSTLNLIFGPYAFLASSNLSMEWHIISDSNCWTNMFRFQECMENAFVGY